MEKQLKNSELIAILKKLPMDCHILIEGCNQWESANDAGICYDEDDERGPCILITSRCPNVKSDTTSD